MAWVSYKRFLSDVIFAAPLPLRKFCPPLEKKNTDSHVWWDLFEDDEIQYLRVEVDVVPWHRERAHDVAVGVDDMLRDRTRVQAIDNRSRTWKELTSSS